MTVNKTIIKELAHQYFAGNMPKELIAYLYDQYGEEPLAGDLAPQFFWPRVQSEIKKYIHGELELTLRSDMQKLWERYEELSDITSTFAEESSQLSAENKYLRDYIRFIKCEDEFQHFCEYAHEEKDEYGIFTYYVM